MIAFAVIALLAGPTPPEASCQIHGTVKVTRADDKVTSPPAVIVYVKKVNWDPPVKAYTVHQKNMQFSESLLVMVKHDQIKFQNDDKMDHSVFTSSAPDEGFHFGVSAKPETGGQSLMAVGGYHVQCDIHPKMQMDVLVVPSPFFARVQPDGQYVLPSGLPTAHEAYTLIAWEPHGGETKIDVTCTGGAVTAPEISLTELPAPKLLHSDRKTPYLPRVGY